MNPADMLVGSSKYEIRPVQHRDLRQVAALLCYLTGRDAGENKRYLEWKYLENPFVEEPLGMVAEAGRVIVGFRGYHATPWYIPDSSFQTLVLTPGDTCVHPEHRRRGLSVEMGRLAMREYHPDYRIFLNMTADSSSVPGYLRLGFIPLQVKSRLTLVSPIGLARNPPLGSGSPLDNIEFGDFGDILVSRDPLPAEMSRVAMDLAASEVRLTPLPKERFFSWYFGALRASHVFYYARKQGRVTGYVVLRVGDRRKPASIIDYSKQSFDAVAHILEFMVRSRSFGLIWIYGCTPDPELRRLLLALGFRDNGPIERIRRRMKHVWPLLVRPVKEHPEEDDWCVEGLDIRAISSWQIQEIRSDAV